MMSGFVLVQSRFMNTGDNILQHVRKCPVCEQNYRNARMLLVQKRPDRTGFHITCSSCGTRVLVFVSPGQMGVVSVGMITDLTAGEVRAKLNQSPISPNMVLDMYSKIRSAADSMDSLVNEETVEADKK